MTKKAHQTPSLPPDDPYGIVDACRGLHAAIDALDSKVAGNVGISRNDLRCLNLIDRGPQSPSYIANALGLTTGSVTALLDRLESHGLIERMRDPADRRGLLIQATRDCFARIGPIYGRFAVSLVEMTERQNTRERNTMIRALIDITALCQRAAGYSIDQSS